MKTNAIGPGRLARALPAAAIACGLVALPALAQESGGGRLINTPAEHFAMAPGSVVTVSHGGPGGC